MAILEFGFDFELRSIFELVNGRVVTYDRGRGAWRVMESYFRMDGWGLATVFDLAPFHFNHRFWCSRVDQWRLDPEAFGMVRSEPTDEWLYAPLDIGRMKWYLNRTKCKLYSDLLSEEVDQESPDTLSRAEIQELRIRAKEKSIEAARLMKSRRG
ncbi:MAG TPA: hypothetical protein VJ835_04465 [Fimbriimonadaceae bacterium]|nr:hypothetical protein [Fimbriimonadaceae bacterium]